MAAVLNDTVEIVVDGQADGQDVDTVLHYRVTANTPPTTLADILTGFQTVWGTDVLSILSDSYRTLQYTAKILNFLFPGPNGPVPIYSEVDVLAAGVGDVGVVGGAALPTYTTASMRKRSGGVATTAYRGANNPPPAVVGEKIFRGGIHLGTIPEVYTQVANQNSLEVATQALIQANVDGIMNFLSGSGSGTLDLVIMSMFLRGAVRLDSIGLSTTFATQLVASLTCSPNVGTQTSRKRPPSL